MDGSITARDASYVTRESDSLASERTLLRVLTRVFLLTIFVAGIAGIAEVSFVFAMRLIGHRVPFTPFFALALFSGMAGFIPLQPSPSRISSAPISLVGRMLLVIETAACVAAAMFASSRFMASRHIVMPMEIWFAAYAYVLILIVMLIANFGRLRHEISASS